MTGVLLAVAAAGSAPAQTAASPAPIDSSAALARDAETIAQRLELSPSEALDRLRLQDASVAVTDALAERFAGRLAGIAIEQRPQFRILVRLTGDATVADETAVIDGTPVPIVYTVGAAASHTAIVQAIATYQAQIRASLLGPPGLGVDPRTGELVAVVSPRDIAREGAEPLRARLAALTRVPVRLRVIDQPVLDLGAISGGGRVTGTVPGDDRRYLCTSGFVVTDGVRQAIATAAHCPDELVAQGSDGETVTLPFIGQWGWGYHDVQINALDGGADAAFYADTARAERRPVTGARRRASLRAGDIVCHRGERTGYSCAPVELTDFAPAGDLCGGACLPTWTTVAGPGCKGGDSGGPVFLGTTAYGLLKGGSYRADGSCAFYFFMSTDFLPVPWQLAIAPPGGSAAPAAGVPPGAGL
jgi:hypothetical protein